jgi:phosphate transport system permease protein
LDSSAEKVGRIPVGGGTDGAAVFFLGSRMQPRQAYTGRPRERKTRRSVLIAEVLSRLLVTFGGIGTIIAVVTVFVFLLYVVIPLFQSAAVTGEERTPGWTDRTPIHVGLDEDQSMVWGVFPDGVVELVYLKTGKVLDRRKLFDGPALTAWSFAARSNDAVFGFADGSVRTGTIGIATRFLDGEPPADVQKLEPGQTIPFEKGTITRTDSGPFRVAELDVQIKEPAKGATRSPVLLVDQTTTTSGVVIAVLNAGGKLRLNTVREQTNLLTGDVTYKLSGVDLPYEEPPGKGRPLRLALSAVGDQVFAFWKDGHMVRFDARDRGNVRLAETRDVLEAPQLAVTEIRQLIGKSTFLIGDSSGRLRGWFYANSSEASTPDGGTMVCAHTFAETGSAMTALAVSERSRMAAGAHADGTIRVHSITSERVMADLRTGDTQPIRAVAIAPKDDGVVAVAAGNIWHWTMDPRHPEVSPRMLFAEVWYEGYDAPQYMWQASGGTDDFEPKLSLIPLIFGTLKATFYSLLFGIPIALLAAVYTSEFLTPRARALLKPTIELMASLPSVVLGFLAGLVFAQFVEKVVPAVLACVVTVPLALLVGAYLWQLLPDKLSILLSRSKFLFVCLALPVGMLLAVPAGSLLERVLFAGDLRGWLDGGAGSAAGGWVLVLVPICALVTTFLMGRYANPWLRAHLASWNKRGMAIVSLGKFAVGCGCTLLLAVALAWLFTSAGMDARHNFLGPYSQRNALVVGFVMGFAIIPIIFTLADDALSAVPEHLRAGSLAAGATRWQTAVRIVIPTAMSGLFSAVMIGTGRAVGETMIVLMATGNTPVMDWNIFNGFRTLSATIAVELPEAVRNSSHYRTLFLAALTLFAMTFVLNTLAELVRLRFRKRAYQL